MSQFGFRKNISAETAFLTKEKFILEHFSRNRLVLRVFIHFTKAFDNLNHSILLGNLDVYGFRGVALNLQISCLGNGQEYVEINDI